MLTAPSDGERGSASLYSGGKTNDQYRAPDLTISPFDAFRYLIHYCLLVIPMLITQKRNLGSFLGARSFMFEGREVPVTLNGLYPLRPLRRCQCFKAVYVCPGSMQIEQFPIFKWQLGALVAFLLLVRRSLSE